MPDDADDYDAFFRPRTRPAADQPTAAWDARDPQDGRGEDGRGGWSPAPAPSAERPAPPAAPADWGARDTPDPWSPTAALRAEPPTTPGAAPPAWGTGPATHTPAWGTGPAIHTPAWAATAAIDATPPVPPAPPATKASPASQAPPADWGTGAGWATTATPRSGEPPEPPPGGWASPQPEPGRGAWSATEPAPPRERSQPPPGRPADGGWSDSGWSDSGWSDGGWSDSGWSDAPGALSSNGWAASPERPSPDAWPGAPEQPGSGWPGSQPGGGRQPGSPERAAPDGWPGQPPVSGAWSGSPGRSGGEGWSGSPGQPAKDGRAAQPAQTQESWSPRDAWSTREAWPVTDATGPFRRPGASRPPRPPRPGASRTGRRWRTPAIIAATLIVVAGGAYLVGHQGSGGASAGGQAAPTASAAGAAHRAAPTMLAAGKVGSRADVPWSLVGKGWVLAQYSAGHGQPTLLYLVDPAGGRYLMRRWRGSWHLVDWSGDATRALLAATRGRRVALRQLVLAKGTTTSFTLPPGVQPVSYTRPDGLNLIAVTATGGVERFNLAGVLQARLARGPAPGAPAGSTDGVTLALGGRKGLGLVSNAGGAIRPLPVPGVNHKVGCTPIRWWNAGTVLAACAATSTSRSQLWLVPASKAKPTPLTPPRSATSPDQGDLNAWRLASGLYLQVAGACGAESIDRPGAGGSVTPVTVSGSPTGNNHVLGVVRDKMLVLAANGCSAGGSLLEVKPATGASVTLLAAPSGGPGVLAAIPYGTPNS